MVVIPSTSYMHGKANLSMEERRHIAVLLFEVESEKSRQRGASKVEERAKSRSEGPMMVKSGVELNSEVST